MVWELYDSLRDSPQRPGAAAVPIIGMGGIANTEDALEFLMAGAGAVQVGSATFPHPNTMIEIIEGLHEFMKKQKLKTLGELSIRN
jgi:dihydroorotate dehydrogenase (NAD+) catalytic subunit